MRYRLVAVGGLKRGPLAAACDRYRSRLEPYAQLDLVEVKQARGGADAVREHEGAALWGAAQGRVVVLDERGSAYTTEALARHVGELELRGESRLSLLLGGAEGHAPWLRERADEVWSLSPLTLPHDLARVVVLEQLYRIETLRAGHPYHRG